jgi:hypothetical protein
MVRALVDGTGRAGGGRRIRIAAILRIYDPVSNDSRGAIEKRCARPAFKPDAA